MSLPSGQGDYRCGANGALRAQGSQPDWGIFTAFICPFPALPCLFITTWGFAGLRWTGSLVQTPKCLPT